MIILKKIHGMILSTIKRIVLWLYLNRYLELDTLNKIFEKLKLKSA
jgi:hypothetical protein